MIQSARRRSLVGIALTLLGVLALCGLGLERGFLSFACMTPPPPPCPIETLLIDETVIPEPLVEWLRGDPVDLYGVEFEEILFRHSQKYDGGKINHAVYRGWNEHQAVRGYRDFVDTYFYTGRSFHCDDEQTVWMIPPEINFESEVADEWRLGCTVGCTTHVQRCQYIGRYGVYFVWTYAWMSDVVTYAEFEHVLQDIDARMVQCLEQADAE